VSTVIIASDTASVRKDVASTIDSPELEIIEASSGPEVIELATTEPVDLVIADLQMGSMGAIAVCLELRLQASYGAIDPVPFLMLLDRRADVFQARRSGAEGWLVKPLDAIRVRRALRALLEGRGYDDPSFQPVPVLVADTPS